MRFPVPSILSCCQWAMSFSETFYEDRTRDCRTRSIGQKSNFGQFTQKSKHQQGAFLGIPFLCLPFRLCWTPSKRGEKDVGVYGLLESNRV
jgi:hypothetical protein